MATLKHNGPADMKEIFSTRTCQTFKKSEATNGKLTTMEVLRNFSLKANTTLKDMNGFEKMKQSLQRFTKLKIMLKMVL